MQRIRVTERGLQANFGADILTIERAVDPVMGDSLGFHYKGSISGAKDFMHGPDFDTTGEFRFDGRDPVDLFLAGTEQLLAKELKGADDASQEDKIEEFPEADQRFYEYTLDRYKRVAAIGVSSTVVNERMLEIYPQSEATDEILKLALKLTEKLSALLGITDGSLTSAKAVDRADVASYGYSLGVETDDTVVLFAEQKYDSLRLVVNNALRDRIRIPALSMQRLSSWMRANYNDPELKKMSVWG